MVVVGKYVGRKWWDEFATRNNFGGIDTWDVKMVEGVEADGRACEVGGMELVATKGELILG